FFLAWLYSGAFVRPPGPRCDRSPPRRPDEMSRVDVRLLLVDSPERARSLFTVRAAISSATSVERPCAFRPCLMWLYWRSRFLLHACGGMTFPSSDLPLGLVPARAGD